MRRRRTRIGMQVLIAVLVLAMGTAIGFAESKISVYVNGHLTHMEAEPQIVNDRVMVPIRFVSQALGVGEDNVVWDAKEKSVTILKDGRSCKMIIGYYYIRVNDSVVKIDSPAIILGQRTYVPVRVVAEALDCTVDWEQNTKSVLISSNAYGVTPSLGVGSMSGNITWQYNDFIGTRGDTGAQITLIPENYPLGTVDTDIFATAFFPDNWYTTWADGYGQYNLNNIPEGRYIVFVISGNTSPNPQWSTAYTDTISKYFTDESVERLETITARVCKIYVSSVELKANQVTTLSHDFGNTYF